MKTITRTLAGLALPVTSHRAATPAGSWPSPNGDLASGKLPWECQVGTTGPPGSPIAIAGNAVLVPAGGPSVFGVSGESPRLVVYTVP